MPTHEYWQFAFVKDVPSNILAIPSLGASAPLRVEMSNLPPGTAPDEEAPNTVVSSAEPNHLRIYWAFPTDPEGYTLTGEYEIRRKTKEFPRAPTEGDLVDSGTISPFTRNEYTLLIDSVLAADKPILYYTIFFTVQDAQSNQFSAYSPIYGHDRGFALTADSSVYGEQMYNYFPRRIRQLDYQDQQQPLYNLCQIFGRVFDENQERLDKFSDTRHDPNKVDAALIPYIDQMLGWPTNFELRETSRRDETANIIDVWKAKGTYDALELALQDVTGWSIDFHEGYNHVVTTATADDFLDPSTAPSDWDQATDGVWADLVNASPFNGTPDLSGSYTYSAGSYGNSFRVMYNQEDWQNTYGLLVELVSAVTSDALSANLAMEKVLRLMPYLSIHYASWKLRVVENYSEVVTLDVNDSHTDTDTSP